MTDNVENLLLEHLKRFQAGQDRIERKLEEVITRIGQLEIGLAGLRRDFAHADENAAGLSVRMDRMSDRIERVEKRLELA
jgi:phage shock protein A